MCSNGRLKNILLVAAACALSACTVGPNYVKPNPLPKAAAMPIEFKESKGWKFAQPSDTGLQPGWWKLFNDPLLSSLEEQVVISNQNVAAAEAQYRQAKALVQATRSGYFPTATVGPSVTHSRSSANLVSGGKGGATITDYSLPADVAWEPDIWGRIRRSVESSSASAQASAGDLAAAQLSAQAELAQDYFLLRSQDAQRQLLNDTVLAFQKALDLTRNRYAAGVVANSDVLQAETQLTTTQAQAIDLDVQRAQLEHAIALLIGKPASSFSIPVAPLTNVLPVIPSGLPSQLLERRPDIASAERRMAAANAQIGVAEAAFYPNVSLSASAGFEALSPANWLSWPSRFWALGAAVSETVFDGGLRRAQTEEARAAYDATIANYRQTVLTGFQEVEDNLAALRILETEARAQNAAVLASRKNLAVALNQYKGGIVDYLNVITAQSAALTNERAEVTIQARRLTASVLLIKALGGGWDASSLRAGAAPAGK